MHVNVNGMEEQSMVGVEEMFQLLPQLVKMLQQLLFMNIPGPNQSCDERTLCITPDGSRTLPMSGGLSQFFFGCNCR